MSKKKKKRTLLMYSDIFTCFLSVDHLLHEGRNPLSLKHTLLLLLLVCTKHPHTHTLANECTCICMAEIFSFYIVLTFPLFFRDLTRLDVSPFFCVVPFLLLFHFLLPCIIVPSSSSLSHSAFIDKKELEIFPKRVSTHMQWLLLQQR